MSRTGFKVHTLATDRDAVGMNEPRCEKTCLRGFRHKPGCTAIEDGQRLEISDLDRRGIALFM